MTPGYLPKPLTSFIGRERELVDVDRLIDRSRLLTLTGAGGSGKTRLALEAARRARPAYPDGVWFVDLAVVGESLLVADAVSEALGLDSGTAPSRGQALVDQLRDRSLLVVLDNCEHLLAACAQLVAALLAGCPGVDVLATSREPLHTLGEYTFRVPSLALPPPVSRRCPRPGRVGPAAVGPALRRAGSAGPAGLRPRRRQCAGRGRPVPPARRDAPGPGAGGGPGRRARTGRDRAAARRCPVDARWRSRAASPGTRRSAARWNGATTCSPSRRRSCSAGCRCSRVDSPSPPSRRSAATDPLARPELLDLLANLVDKSLVVTEKTPPGPATGNWRRSGSSARRTSTGPGRPLSSQAAHCAYFLAFAVAHNPERATGVVIEQPKLLDREHDNLRAALRWSCAHDPETALRLVASLWRFWFLRGHAVEGAAGSSAPWPWRPSRPGPARPP